MKKWRCQDTGRSGKPETFYNACRHHVYELVVGAAYKAVFGKETSAPENPHFHQFRSRWSKLDLTQDISTLDLTCKWMRSHANLVVLELQQLLGEHTKDKEVFIRDDYREYAENALAILGSSTKNFRYCRPGTTNSLWWMGKVIYCQKMFMLANQLEYEEDDMAKLHRKNMFVCIFYVTAGLKCNVSADAPINDLSFIKYMQKYCQIDHEIVEPARDKLMKHRCYLCEESIVFALFSA